MKRITARKKDSPPNFPNGSEQGSLPHACECESMGAPAGSPSLSGKPKLQVSIRNLGGQEFKRFDAAVSLFLRDIVRHAKVRGGSKDK